MTMRDRFALTVAGAALFGLAAGVVHGNDGGLRAAVGNLSAPWLLVALIPAWWSGSAVRGAVLGTSATVVALVGFYVGLTAVMYGHLGATHGIIRSFEFVLRANRIWFAAGLMSGPLCGAVAGTLGVRLSPAWLVAVLGVLFVGEIVVVVGFESVRLPVLHIRWGASDLRGYLAEAALGLLTLAVLAVRRLRTAR